MTATTHQFRHTARIAIEDVRLSAALAGATGRFSHHREQALSELPDFDALRDHLKRIRATTIENLGHHLQAFERNAQSAGAHVHWASDAAEACEIILQIGHQHGAKIAAKSKSMATEEIHLNEALTAADIRPIETDLGEWIIQLAGEKPSHIIAPAIHKTKEQVSELFQKEAGKNVPADIPTLTEQARNTLREVFLAADIGISGGNIAVAETGSIVLVTNEGNGRMVTSLPPVHIALIGIEKIAPTWQDAAAWIALLARSATGQPLSVYTNIVTGPKKPGDLDGPDEVHIVLLDNGRSQLLGTEFQEVLECIRCGACLNVCPVYRKSGGHAYGSPYSGPIGAVISPLLFGLEQFSGTPQASSLCGACLDVCPVRIDLPRMLIELRKKTVEENILPPWERWLERGAARVMSDPRWLQGVRTLGTIGQNILDPSLPRLARRSFREIWKDGLENEGADG